MENNFISPSGGPVAGWVWTTSTIFVATFQIIFFYLDRVQVVGGVEQSKFIVRVQLHSFFSSSRDLENVLYSLPERKSGSTTIADVVYFVECHPPRIFINLTQLWSCSGSKLDVRTLKEAIDIYFGGQQRLAYPKNVFLPSSKVMSVTFDTSDIYVNTLSMAEF